MIPGEYFPSNNPSEIEANVGLPVLKMPVSNGGDRPIQVGSHFHFAEANSELNFDRTAARGMRLNIPAGTAVRFEPGDSREVELVPVGGQRIIHGFSAKVNGPL